MTQKNIPGRFPGVALPTKATSATIQTMLFRAPLAVAPPTPPGVLPRAADAMTIRKMVALALRTPRPVAQPQAIVMG